MSEHVLATEEISRDAHLAQVTKAAYVQEHYSDYDDYDEVVLEEYGYQAHIKIPRAILERLTPDLEENGEVWVLDCGCGTGLSSQLFLEHCQPLCRVIGMDLSQEMLDRAAAVADARAAAGTARKFERLLQLSVEGEWPTAPVAEGGVPDSLFGAAVMLGVLEFVANPAATLLHIAAKLRPGGLLGLVTPLTKPFGDERAMGIRTHSGEGVRAAAAAAGLELVHSESFLGYKWTTIEVHYDGTVWRKRAPPSDATSTKT